MAVDAPAAPTGDPADTRRDRTHYLYIAVIVATVLGAPWVASRPRSGCS